jgi:hypothetical protein
MVPAEFEEHNVIYAKNQPEYLPLPAYQFKNKEGRIVFCWQMSWRERFRLFCTGKIWHQVLTFNEELQPQKLTAEKPKMVPEYEP